MIEDAIVSIVHKEDFNIALDEIFESGYSFFILNETLTKITIIIYVPSIIATA
jgi:hypothetical protein